MARSVGGCTMIRGSFRLANGQVRVACADAGKTRALLQDFAAAKLKLR